MGYPPYPRRKLHIGVIQRQLSVRLEKNLLRNVFSVLRIFEEAKGNGIHQLFVIRDQVAETINLTVQTPFNNFSIFHE
jgi:hypothetical protein